MPPPIHIQTTLGLPVLGLFCFVAYNANLRSIGGVGDNYPARYLPLSLWKMPA
ncbi:hypothetical protein GCM10027082_26680 [Comamonas humi]